MIEIYEYSLLNFGIIQADLYQTSMEETLLLLAGQPKLGRVFREYRRHEHGQHVIFYRIEKYGIKVAYIFHASETLENKL